MSSCVVTAVELVAASRSPWTPFQCLHHPSLPALLRWTHRKWIAGAGLHSSVIDFLREAVDSLLIL
jgi:hypothetical protein